MPLESKPASAVLQELIQKVKKLEPTAEVRARIESFRHAYTRFAKNEVTTSGESDESEISLYVALGQKHAEARSNQVDAASLATLAARTVSLARVAPVDPEAMPVLGASKLPAAAASFDVSTSRWEATHRAEAARVAIETAKRDNLIGAGFIEHASGMVALATSAGLSVQQPLSSIELSITARTSDGTGSGWASTTSRSAKSIDAQKVAQVACGKARLAQKPHHLEAGRYTVLLEPAAAAEMTQFLMFSLNARNADEGRSFFSKPQGGSKLGEKVLPSFVTLQSAPSASESPGLMFDEEGLTLSPLTWIEKGTLKSMYTSRYWAKKNSLKATGRYQGATLSSGDKSFEEMLSSVKRGILVTRFWYSNLLDPQTIAITALTRDGTFLIEDGNVSHAVNNFRINESVVRALEQCEAVGKEAPMVFSPDSRCPALLVRDFNFASVSDAV